MKPGAVFYNTISVFIIDGFQDFMRIPSHFQLILFLIVVDFS